MPDLNSDNLSDIAAELKTALQLSKCKPIRSVGDFQELLIVKDDATPAATMQRWEAELILKALKAATDSKPVSQ